MAAISPICSEIFHPVEFHYPTPKLRLPVWYKDSDFQIARQLQMDYLNHYHSQATKAVARGFAVYTCYVLAMVSLKTAVTTLTIAYSYIAVAALVTAYVLKTFWKRAPEDLYNLALEEIKKKDHLDHAAPLICAGAADCNDLVEEAVRAGQPNVLRDLLCLGFGSTEDAWNAPDVATAEIFVSFGLPDEDISTPLADRFADRLRDKLLTLSVRANEDPSALTRPDNISYYMNRLKVFIYYAQKRQEFPQEISSSFGQLCSQDAQAIKKFIDQVLAKIAEVEDKKDSTPYETLAALGYTNRNSTHPTWTDVKAGLLMIRDRLPS